MQVYKFGGASIATPELMSALLPILAEVKTPLVIVISAIGKTTNALEQIAQTAISGDRSTADQLLNDLEKMHHDYVVQLFPKEISRIIIDKLHIYFTEIAWALDDAGIQPNGYIYDQIVCVGELLSSIIFSEYLNSKQIHNAWIDARDLIKTDENYRQANVDELATEKHIKQRLLPLLKQNNVCIIQGFIGATHNNSSTTLGREGSDYTAALIAALIQAKKVTIWKDVPGFLNADPRLFPDAVRIPEITFHEVIELTYYGAQIIHPKTIKPLYNHNIPLYVKCFFDPTLEGTFIHTSDNIVAYPPLIVIKPGQLLLQLTTLDFSFISEEDMSQIYRIFSAYNVKINLLQHTAISIVACVDKKHFGLQNLVADLSQFYTVKRNEQATLLTIRHYDQETIDKLIKNKNRLLEQKTRHTYQALYQ